MSLTFPLEQLQDASPRVVIRNLLIWTLTFILFFDTLIIYGVVPIGALILNGVKLFGFFLFIVYAVFFRETFERRNLLLCLAFIPLFWIYAGEENPVTAGLKIISRFIPIFGFLLIDWDAKKKIFYTWVKLYTYSLIPAIIIHITKLVFSVAYPYFEVQNILGESYDSHFGIYFYYRWNYIRFCGLYDEPGVVGTFSFFLLGFFSHQLTQLQKFILWITGIMALSFFFIGSIPLLLFCRLLLNRKYLTLTFSAVATLLFLASLPLIISMVLRANNKSTVYQDLVMHTIKSRLNVNQDDFSVSSIKTNRLNSQNYTFDNFKREPLSTKLLGNNFAMGTLKFGAITEGGLGVEIYMYQYGILMLLYTFVFLVLFIILPAKVPLFRAFMALLLLLMCLYTRPLFFRLEFVVLIYMGMIALKDFKLPQKAIKQRIAQA